MAIFHVPVTYEVCARVEMDADSRDEAYEKVEKLADEGKLIFGQVQRNEYILGTMQVEWEED